MATRIQEFLNSRYASLTGAGYFLLLGFVNLVATFITAELRVLDWMILSVCLLPMLIRRKGFLLGFGILSGLISLYCFFACLLFSLNPEVQTGWFAFLMGFLLTGSAFLASVILVFAGINLDVFRGGLQEK